jgi:RNA polymerase sigma-70 factor (ECF subfamily)
MKGKFKKMATTWNGTISDAAGQLANSVLNDAVEAHWAGVCRILYRLMGDWDEAEDLALEVFYRLHQRPPRDLDKLQSWLYRVATNLGYNALRARKRRRRYEEEAGLFRLEHSESVDPAAEVERQQAQARVRRVLAGMKKRPARLLMLRYEGFSYAEIADVLNVAPGSVGTMLARAEKAFERRYRTLEDEHETSK